MPMQTAEETAKTNLIEHSKTIIKDWSETASRAMALVRNLATEVERLQDENLQLKGIKEPSPFVAHILREDTIINALRRAKSEPLNPEVRKILEQLPVRDGSKSISDKKQIQKFQECAICGWRKSLDWHHIYLNGTGIGEGSHVIRLCPNHHAMVTRGLL